MSDDRPKDLEAELAAREDAVRDSIVGTVLELVETGGYEAVQLRVVASRAQVSLTTVYKHFGSRNGLLVAAVEQWMASNIFEPLPSAPPGTPRTEALLSLFRTIFESWQKNPQMLRVFWQVRSAPEGESLRTRGMSVVDPLVRPLFADAGRAYRNDTAMILGNVVFALITKFADGEIAIEEILSQLERTIRRLAHD